MFLIQEGANLLLGKMFYALMLYSCSFFCVCVFNGSQKINKLFAEKHQARQFFGAGSCLDPEPLGFKGVLLHFVS